MTYMKSMSGLVKSEHKSISPFPPQGPPALLMLLLPFPPQGPLALLMLLLFVLLL